MGRADKLTTILCRCHEIWVQVPNFLEPSGPLQACNGTDLPFTVAFVSCAWGAFVNGIFSHSTRNK